MEKVQCNNTAKECYAKKDQFFYGNRTLLTLLLEIVINIDKI